MRMPATITGAVSLYQVPAFSVEFVTRWVQYGELVPNPWRIERELAPHRLELTYLASHLPLPLALALNAAIPALEARFFGMPTTEATLAGIHGNIVDVLEKAADIHGVHPDPEGPGSHPFSEEELARLRTSGTYALH